MTSKDFEIDDLVWAKMKGYPFWPGKIIEPPSDAKAKPKKNHHYVYFFGSLNHAWIADEFIKLHSEEMLEKYGQRKGELFRKAVQTIAEHSEEASMPHTPTKTAGDTSEADESDNFFDKIGNGGILSKSKSPQEKSTPRVIKKKLKKVHTPSSLDVKAAKKRAHSPEQSESNLKVFRIDDYDDDDVNNADDDDNNADDDVDADSSSVTFHNIFPQKEETLNDESPAAAVLPDEVLNGKIPSYSRKYIERPNTPPVDLMYTSEIFKKKKIKPTHKKIGFLGLSKVGQGIIKNLHHSGHSITIWNQESDESKKLVEQLKVKIASTPTDVIEVADIIFCCMNDSDAVKEVVEGNCGILEGLSHFRENKGYVEMTSLDPKMSQEIGTKIKVNGGRYLEAPMCGGRIEAIEGTLLIVAAGDQTLYDDCKSCFDAISKKHMFVSAEVGTASKLNVVNNMFIGTVYASLAEILCLLDRVGIKGPNFLEILKVTGLNSTGLQRKLKSMVDKNYVADIPLKQMQKNFNVGLALGHEISQRTPVFASAKEAYKNCIDMKYGDHDVSAVYEGTR